MTGKIKRFGYSIQEIAKVLNVNPKTVLRLLFEQEVDYFKAGRVYRIYLEQKYFISKGITAKSFEADDESNDDEVLDVEADLRGRYESKA